MKPIERPLIAIVLLGIASGCGTEGELGAPVGFATPSAYDVVSEELYVALSEVDPISGGVDFYLNDVLVDTDQLPPYETWLDTTMLDDGIAHLTARPAGKQRTALDEVDIIVDNRGPAILFDTPMVGSCVASGMALDVRARVEDDVGVRTAELRVDGERVAVFESAPYELMVPPTSMGLVGSDATEHRLTIAAENTRGRISNATMTVPICASQP